jgi:hypothetical protein
MTLDDYNLAVKATLAEQQALARDAATLCISGSPRVMSPEFVQLLSRPGTLIQQLAKLNAEAMLGVGMSNA